MILISFIVFIMAFMMFSLMAGSLRISKLNLISFIFYKDFLLLTFFGAIFVFFEYDLSNDVYFWGVTGHISRDSRFYGWLSINYTMLAFPFGGLIANLFLLKKISAKRILVEYYNRECLIDYPLYNKNTFLICCFFLAISFFSVIYTFYGMNYFPLLELIMGNENHFELAQMRADAKFSFQGNKIIRDQLAINLTFLLSLIIYCFKLKTGDKKLSILFFFSFIQAFFILTYNLEKSVFFFYLFSLIIVKYLCDGARELKKIFFYFLFTALAFLVFYSSLTEGDDILNSFLYRVFVAQSVAIFQGFEYFPNRLDFLGVTGISNFVSGLFNADYINPGTELFYQYNPQAIHDNVAGHIVGLFNAESWILFGKIGVIIIPIYVGFVVQLTNLLFLKSKKSPWSLALYVFIFVKISISGGVVQFIYPIMFFFIFSIYYSIYKSNIIFRRKECIGNLS